MLASAGTVSVVADALRRYGVKYAVVDPVMVATSGAQLLPENAMKTLCDQLLPATYIATPNIPEAKLMLEKAGKPPVTIRDLDGMKELAHAVHKLGPKYVLIKGGHLPLTSQRKVAGPDDDKSIVANVLYGDDVHEVVELAYQRARNTHGTGCTLTCQSPLFPLTERLADGHSAAIACYLANGVGIASAVRSACRYVEAGIKTSGTLGKGSGPLNHFHSLQSLPFPP